VFLSGDTDGSRAGRDSLVLAVVEMNGVQEVRSDQWRRVGCVGCVKVRRVEEIKEAKVSELP
jgi:hypothetical protein